MLLHIAAMARKLRRRGRKRWNGTRCPGAVMYRGEGLQSDRWQAL